MFHVVSKRTLQEKRSRIKMMTKKNFFCLTIFYIPPKIRLLEDSVRCFMYSAFILRSTLLRLLVNLDNHCIQVNRIKLSIHQCVHHFLIINSEALSLRCLSGNPFGIMKRKRDIIWIHKD